MDNNSNLRNFLDILTQYENSPMPAEVVSMEVIGLEASDICVVSRLEDLVSRLRAHRDQTGGDYSLGFERGLEMAAQMVENLKKSLGEEYGS